LVWVKVFGFSAIALSPAHDAEPKANLHAQVSVFAQDEYVTQSSSSSSDKPIHFDSHADDFIECEEEKSERKSELDFFPVLFIGFLIDYFSSKGNINLSLLSYSGLLHYSVAIFLLDCVFLI
jgi:hypothetical protein